MNHAFKRMVMERIQLKSFPLELNKKKNSADIVNVIEIDDALNICIEFVDAVFWEKYTFPHLVKKKVKKRLEDLK